jgi:hypothetical protein
VSVSSSFLRAIDSFWSMARIYVNP